MAVNSRSRTMLAKGNGARAVVDASTLAPGNGVGVAGDEGAELPGSSHIRAANDGCCDVVSALGGVQPRQALCAQR